MNIGKNIKYLRQQQKMTQEQVAERLGITYQSVSKWENDTNTPDIALLPDIAALFGVSIDALFADTAPQQDVLAELLPLIKDDDVIRIVQMQGKRVLKVSPRPSPDAPPIEIAFPRNCNDSTQYFSVEIMGSVVCDGSINGDVVCHQDIECANINGDVVCKPGTVKCSTLNGDVAAASLECVDINGDVACKELRACQTIHAASVECAGDIHCDKILYTK